MRNQNTQIALTYWTNLRRGSRSALFELYNTFYDDLYNYGFKISNDDALTRDIIHDLFVDLWTKCKSLPEIRSVKPYLLRIMRNMILDQIREYRKGINLENSGLIIDEIQFSYEEMILTREMNSEVGHQLAFALSCLPARQKEMIQLRFYHRCSYDEMMEITGVNYQSVRNTISRALKNLKKFFREEVTKLH